MKTTLLQELVWTIRRRLISIDPAYKELYEACMQLLRQSDLELRSVFFGVIPEDPDGMLVIPGQAKRYTYRHLAVAVESMFVERTALAMSGIAKLSGHRGDFPGSVARLLFRRWRWHRRMPLHENRIPFMNKLIVGSLGLKYGNQTLFRRIIAWLYKKNPNAVANTMRILNRARLFHARLVYERDPITDAVLGDKPPIGIVMFVSKNPELPQEKFNEPAERLSQIFLRNHHHLPQVQAHLKESEERFRSLVEMMPVAHAVHRDGRFLYINPRGLEMLGAQDLNDLNRRPVIDYVHPESRQLEAERINTLLTGDIGVSVPLMEEKLIRMDGAIVDAEVVSTKIKYEGFEAIQVAFHDLSPLRSKQEELRFLAFHDPMTALWNRIRFRRLLSEAIQREGSNPRGFSLFYIDLDGFKNINDLLGHTEGDEFLKLLAFNLRMKDDFGTLARLGGDEFGLLYEGTTDPADIHRLGIELLRVISQPITLARGTFSVKASIGVAVYPLHGADPETLMKNADLAGFAAKGRGRNNVFIYDDALERRLHVRLQLEQELNSALLENQFQLHYQPIRDAASGRIAALEALIRWNHPSGRMRPPMDFISLAEETGQIVDIGRWVLGEACRQCREFQRAGIHDVTMAVNVSPIQLDRDDFFTDVAGALKETGIAGASLELEITEESAVSDPDRTSSLITRLSSVGVRTTIDDFGMGRSALAYFKQFPAHGVKVDQSFVRGILKSEKDAAIVRAIIAIARSLRLKVTAEGIESPEQESWLRGAGCDFLQGFHTGRPDSAEAVLTLLHHEHAGENRL